jgi:NADPH-dependent glutamate synthase beta subunit-like oxidoreductase/coenzyme F420-reducing hydrogenase delta subunit/Pyruvate/2-oxoacid:ferredoxin oxidoreductase delta subunit
MSDRDTQPCAIIVGNGPPHAQAALDLARAGVRVSLVTASEGLAPGALGPMGMPLLHEAARHPSIHLLTGARIQRIRPAQGGAKACGVRVTVRQSPRYVDAGRCTACGACGEICPVQLPGGILADGPGITMFAQAKTGLAREADGSDGRRAIYRGGIPTAYAIDKAGTAPCRHACPIDQRAQGYVALLAAGEFEAAYRAIKRENPFPSVCGRVCSYRCEESCTRSEVDEPVAVMALKRFAADWAAESGFKEKVEKKPASGYRVAIVGSGPAGLTAARDLNRWGHSVTVLEALSEPGGMMRVGIPAFRLPRERLREEIDEILTEGVQLCTNTRVDDVESLFSAGHDVVVLALGLHVSRRIPIPGAEEPGEATELSDARESGVLGAVEFLRQVNLGQRPDWTGQRVLVVGGGSTAMDTARVCRRLGAEVKVLYRRSRTEMPAHDSEVSGAEREGVALQFLANPTRVLRDGGQVTAVECVRMALGERDESGRRRPAPVEGSEFTIPADVVVLAVGQTSDLSCLTEVGGTPNRSGLVAHDSRTLMTSRPGLFVAGDLAGTGGFVVDAIASGARVARAVDRYLRGSQGAREPVKQPVVHLRAAQVTQHLTRSAPKGTSRARPRSAYPERLLGDFGETEVGLTEREAMAEAARCLGCGDCSECLACVEVCPAGAIDHQARAQMLELQADAFIGMGGGEEFGIHDSALGCSELFLAADGTGLGEAVNGVLLQLGLSRAGAMEQVVAPSRRIALPFNAVDWVGGRLYEAHEWPIGVFLCRCGGEIERVVDLSAVAARLDALPGVAYVGYVDFACHLEGAAAVRSTVAAELLGGAVLAACSCCSLDQICYSCTTQRIRCKERLGVWDGLKDIPLAFVNIREGSAFVHRYHPQAATTKAGDMVAASVASLTLAGAGSPTLRQNLAFSSSTAQRTALALPAVTPVPITAVVDPVRCRGCDDCEIACGLEAIGVLRIDGTPLAQVNGAVCLGCGVCMSACSSGAIRAGDTGDEQVEAMLAAMGGLAGKTVVFSCNWGAYSALEAAAVERLSYDASVRLVRLMCAGRVHPGLILRAFGLGAARVLVLACEQGDHESICHYGTGYRLARRSVEQAQALLGLLGIDPNRLNLAALEPGDGAGFVASVAAVVDVENLD